MKYMHYNPPPAEYDEDRKCCVNEGESYSPDDTKRYSTTPDYTISMSNSTYRQRSTKSNRRNENAWGNQKMAEEGLNLRQRI